MKGNEGEVERLVQFAEKVEQGIKSGIFYPNDNYMCGICGYGEMCQKW